MDSKLTRIKPQAKLQTGSHRKNNQAKEGKSCIHWVSFLHKKGEKKKEKKKKRREEQGIWPLLTQYDHTFSPIQVKFL